MPSQSVEEFYIEKKQNFISYLKLLSKDASHQEKYLRDEALRDAEYMTYKDMTIQAMVLRALIATGSIDSYIDNLLVKYGIPQPLPPEAREKIGRYIELFSKA